MFTRTHTHAQIFSNVCIFTEICIYMFRTHICICIRRYIYVYTSIYIAWSCKFIHCAVSVARCTGSAQKMEVIRSATAMIAGEDVEKLLVVVGTLPLLDLFGFWAMATCPLAEGVFRGYVTAMCQKPATIATVDSTMFLLCEEKKRFGWHETTILLATYCTESIPTYIWGEVQVDH